MMYLGQNRSTCLQFLVGNKSIQLLLIEAKLQQFYLSNIFVHYLSTAISFVNRYISSG